MLHVVLGFEAPLAVDAVLETPLGIGLVLPQWDFDKRCKSKGRVVAEVEKPSLLQSIPRS